MINYFRKLLIRIGKAIPFFVCLIICLNYAESMLALVTNDLISYGDVVIPNTRISFAIGQYFEYNIQMLVVISIISIAIRTCIYNKLACVYMGFNLWEKEWFAINEYETEVYYLTCVLNIIICSFLCYKGIKQLDLLNFVKFLPKYFVG